MAAAVWKKPVNGSPRSAAAAPSSRQALLAGGQRRTPRGYVPMVLVGDEVGSEHEERIMVHVEMLKEPSMAAVLEMAAQQFGYGQPGVLRIPCGVDRFQQMVGAACEARDNVLLYGQTICAEFVRSLIRISSSSQCAR